MDKLNETVTPTETIYEVPFECKPQGIESDFAPGVDNVKLVVVEVGTNFVVVVTDAVLCGDEQLVEDDPAVLNVVPVVPAVDEKVDEVVFNVVTGVEIAVVVEETVLQVVANITKILTLICPLSPLQETVPGKVKSH